YVDVSGWVETGREVAKWLVARPEIDPDKIAATGSSFGSFFSAIMMSDEPRYKACAITGTCYEPGGYRIFEEASPTFKKRFMFMSGITDEREFDEFRKTLDWHAYAGKVKAPYLVAGGESDELCPLEQTEHFVKALAWISHTILVLWDRFAQVFNGRDAPWRRRTRTGLELFRGCGGSGAGSDGPWDDAAVVTRRGGACQAGEPRAVAAAMRRTAAQPQMRAAGQLDAIAILMRRTLTRTSAPIL